MKLFTQIFSALFFTTLLSACSTAPSTINLDPQATLPNSDIGNGRTVSVQVIDARPQTLDAQYASAPIDPNQNVAAVFKSNIKNGLRLNGFVTVHNGMPANSQMLVKVLAINYGKTVGLAASSTRTTVALEVDASNPTGTYNKNYKANSYSDTYLTVTSANGSQQVNSAVSAVLNNMFADQSLLVFLAR